MDRIFRVSSSFFFLLAMMLAITTAVSMNDAIDVEDIKDPELKERVAQELAAAGEAEVDNSRAPSASLVAKEKRLPYPLCGVFILCERRGGFYGFPDARLFTSFRTGIRVKTTGRCRTAIVRGTSPGGSSTDHARIWPLFGEEFFELCTYVERQHSCTTGRVSVVNSSGATLYQCDQYYDAHSVTFCMSKYPFYCRYRNPADVIFSQVSPARA